MTRPFAEGPGWRVHQGDALEVLVDLRAGGPSFDALLLDGPYSSGGAFRGDRVGDPRKKYLETGSRLARDTLTFEGDTRDQRAFTLWLGLLLARALPCLVPGAPALVFCDWRQLAATVDAVQVGGLVLRGVVPWLKPDHACRPQRGRFRQSAEFIVWGSRGPWPTDRPGVGVLPGHVEAAAPRGRKRLATTEKPLVLLEQLLAICAPGGQVLDPCAGSGSTGEAALRTGRRAVLVEASPDYCAIAARRLVRAGRTPATGEVSVTRDAPARSRDRGGKAVVLGDLGSDGAAQGSSSSLGSGVL